MNQDISSQSITIIKEVLSDLAQKRTYNWECKNNVYSIDYVDIFQNIHQGYEQLVSNFIEDLTKKAKGEKTTYQYDFSFLNNYSGNKDFYTHLLNAKIDTKLIEHIFDMTNVSPLVVKELLNYVISNNNPRPQINHAISYLNFKTRYVREHTFYFKSMVDMVCQLIDKFPQNEQDLIHAFSNHINQSNFNPLRLTIIQEYKKMVSTFSPSLMNEFLIKINHSPVENSLFKEEYKNVVHLTVSDETILMHEKMTMSMWGNIVDRIIEKAHDIDVTFPQVKGLVNKFGQNYQILEIDVSEDNNSMLSLEKVKSLIKVCLENNYRPEGDKENEVFKRYLLKIKLDLQLNDPSDLPRTKYKI